jgi:hypothetical protein
VILPQLFIFVQQQVAFCVPTNSSPTEAQDWEGCRHFGPVSPGVAECAYPLKGYV